MKKKLFVLPFFILIALSSLAQVKTVWKDTRFLKEPIKKLVVVSQFVNGDQRQMAEESIVEALLSKGIDAVGAYEIFTYDSMNYYITLERKLDSANVDGILLMKMVNAKSTDMYVMPGEVIPPYAYNYYEYYSFYYYNELPIINDPNYYRRPNKIFRIDINLYQNKGDMIVWGGQTKAIDPLNPGKVIGKLGKKVVKIMLSQDLIE